MRSPRGRGEPGDYSPAAWFGFAGRRAWGGATNRIFRRSRPCFLNLAYRPWSEPSVTGRAVCSVDHLCKRTIPAIGYTGDNRYPDGAYNPAIAHEGQEHA